MLPSMRKNVLLVGGAGYIGRAIQETGKHNYIVYDLKTGQDARLGIAFPSPVDVIVDLAALKSVPEGEANPEKYYYNNCLVPLVVSRYATFQDIPVVFISSAAIYGHSVYGTTKAIGESIYRDCPQDVAIIRLQNVYGRGGDSVVDIIRNCTSTFTINGCDYETDDGTPSRDYVHVDDVADLVNAYITDPQPCVFDYGTGQGTTVKQLCDYAGVKVEYGPRRDGDVGNCYAVYKTNPLNMHPKRKIEAYFER